MRCERSGRRHGGGRGRRAKVPSGLRRRRRRVKSGRRGRRVRVRRQDGQAALAGRQGERQMGRYGRPGGREHAAPAVGHLGGRGRGPHVVQAAVQRLAVVRGHYEAGAVVQVLRRGRRLGRRQTLHRPARTGDAVATATRVRRQPAPPVLAGRRDGAAHAAHGHATTGVHRHRPAGGTRFLATVTATHRRRTFTR